MTSEMRRQGMDKAFKIFQEYVDEVLASFHHDPADSDYQKGYEAAYKEMQRMLTTMKSAARKNEKL